MVVKLGQSWANKGWGIKWCKSERVNSSEGVKWGKSWAAKGVKWCKSEGVNCPEGVK